jgi:small GTP-binding protein
MADAAPFRAVFIGPENAGKTCLIHRLVTDQFTGDCMTIPSLHASYAPTVFTAYNGGTVTVGLWDTPGQSTHRELMIPPLRNADFIVIVFDLTDRRSFADLRLYHDKGKSVVPPSAAFFLLANKVDLEAKREIASYLVQDYADTIQAIGCLEVSAKTGDGLIAFGRMLGDAALGRERGAMQVQPIEKPPTRGTDCDC